MSKSFAELYQPLTNNVFMEQAQQQLNQGTDGLKQARTYAEEGKPDFTLAYLLLIPADEDLKFDLLALAYEKRAQISEQKAEEFDQKFNRPFPLIKLEAQKDRTSASQVREGKRVRRNATSISVRKV